MAIDSAQKRMSAIAHGCPWRGPLVDATESGFAEGNRLAALYLYAGISSIALGFLRVMAAMAHVPGVRAQRIVYPGPVAGGLYVAGVRQQEVHP